MLEEKCLNSEPFSCSASGNEDMNLKSYLVVVILTMLREIIAASGKWLLDILRSLESSHVLLLTIFSTELDTNSQEVMSSRTILARIIQI